MLRSVDWDRFSEEYASNLKRKSEQNAQFTSDPRKRPPDLEVFHPGLPLRIEICESWFQPPMVCAWPKIALCLRTSSSDFLSQRGTLVQVISRAFDLEDGLIGLLEVGHPENYPALECGRSCPPSYRCRSRLDETSPCCLRRLHTTNEDRYFVAAQRNQR